MFHQVESFFSKGVNPHFGPPANPFPQGYVSYNHFIIKQTSESLQGFKEYS